MWGGNLHCSYWLEPCGVADNCTFLTYKNSFTQFSQYVGVWGSYSYREPWLFCKHHSSRENKIFFPHSYTQAEFHIFLKMIIANIYYTILHLLWSPVSWGRSYDSIFTYLNIEAQRSWVKADLSRPPLGTFSSPVQSPLGIKLAPFLRLFLILLFNCFCLKLPDLHWALTVQNMTGRPPCW